MTGAERIDDWFASNGWAPFAFQREAMAAYASGDSGLVHAATGTGKTLSVWLGPLAEWIDDWCGSTGETDWADAPTVPARVLWITPMRALANDTLEALQKPVSELGLPWTIEKRTGDTSSSRKVRQRDRLPTALVTTPESLTLLLSYPGVAKRFGTVRCVVVDEWHELLSGKRGVQAELAIARLRAIVPDLRVWGLSATLGNLEEARDALAGPAVKPARRRLIAGREPKQMEVTSVLPADMERFPWSGHLGVKMLDPVIDAIELCPGTSLLFTNTRSQAEIWFKRLLMARQDWIGRIAIHHGSLDREVRARVEQMLREGALLAVVCTSSLDLGVDFSPVDQVLQLGSPKGIARLTQRAGRSGHRPGASSRVLCVPAHAFELVEFAAAREGIERQEIEARTPLNKPLDVLVQHLVTVALGDGFRADELLAELRTTHAYRDLTSTELGWAMDFVTRGGPALGAYPEYQRITLDEETDRYRVSSQQIGRRHRMMIGTISADASMLVRFGNGRTLGTIEESFIGRLRIGDRFVFAGRVLEMVRIKEMTVTVRRAKARSGIVPRWQGGRSPLSTRLSAAVRRTLERARAGTFDAPELEAVRPLIELQQSMSVLPSPEELLVERVTTDEGHHVFLFPFEGRSVHEGLGALIAHRLAAESPVTLSVTMNDYGIELQSPTALDPDEATLRRLLRTDDLLEDLLRCLNSGELAKRRFRDIARVAGLIFPGFPGAGRSSRQLQASSSNFFEVFEQFDPANLLLDQAKREVLEQQLEVRRLRETLTRLASMRIVSVATERLTPLAFPLFAETLRTQHVSTETWSVRIARMAADLEGAVGS